MAGNLITRLTRDERDSYLIAPAMRDQIKRFLLDQAGATSIEYALIAAIVSIVIVSGATSIGINLRGSFDQVSSGFASR